MRVKQLKFLIEIERERWALMAAVKLLLRERVGKYNGYCCQHKSSARGRVDRERVRERQRLGEGETARAAHCTLLLLFLFVLLRRVIVLRCDRIIIKLQDFFGKLP